MFTSRFTKPVVGTALAAGTVGLAALLAAGTANADTSDDQFLAALQQQGIGFSNTQSAIGAAHHACDALGQGMEPSEISQHMLSANSHLDQQTAVTIIVDAAQFYCPQYYHQTPSGTFVGPNH
jgi:hypothetical protein